MAEHLISVVHRGDPVAIADASELFEEYREWLGDAVCAFRFAEEISTLPRPYDDPDGRLLLARDESGRAVGCVGVRLHEGKACEIKRLYVRPDARRTGLGRSLMRYALDACRELGYSEVRVSTLPDRMSGALRMYRALGFEPTTPFEDHSHIEDGEAVLFLSRGI